MNATSTMPSSVVSEIAVAAAWQRYLFDTHDAPAQMYEQIEAEAWRRLERRLRLIGKPLDSS